MFGFKKKEQPAYENPQLGQEWAASNVMQNGHYSGNKVVLSSVNYDKGTYSMVNGKPELTPDKVTLFSIEGLNHAQDLKALADHVVDLHNANRK